MGQPEAGSAGVAVDRDHVAAARAGRREQAGPPRAEHEQPHEGRSVQWPRDVDPRGAGRGAESRPRARRELDGAPGGRGPRGGCDGAGGLGRRAARAARRRRARARGEPARRGRGRRRGRAAARRGRRERAARRRASCSGWSARRRSRSWTGGSEQARRSRSSCGSASRTPSCSHTRLRQRCAKPCFTRRRTASSARSRRRRTRAAPSPRTCARTASRSSWSRTTRRPAELEWASVLLLGADTVFHDGTLCNKTGTPRPGRGRGGPERSGRRRLRGDQAGPDRRGRRAGADGRGVRAHARLRSSTAS